MKERKGDLKRKREGLTETERGWKRKDEVKWEMRDEEKHFGMWEREEDEKKKDERQIKRWEEKKGNKGCSRENIEDTPSLQLTKRYIFFIFITYFFGITKFFRIFAGD